MEQIEAQSQKHVISSYPILRTIYLVQSMTSIENTKIYYNNKWFLPYNN
jgi:hypothetical protein